MALAVGPLAAQDAASDRAIAEAGREGLTLLKELQDRQTARQARSAPQATGTSVATPSSPVSREAARSRTGLRHDRKRSGKRPAAPDSNGGVSLTKGICNGCGV